MSSTLFLDQTEIALVRACIKVLHGWGDPINELGPSDEIPQFEAPQQLVDWLIAAYGKVLNHLEQANQLKSQLRDCFNDLAGNHLKLSGTVTLSGDEYQAKITRTLASRYPKPEKGAVSLLQKVYEEVPELRDCISVKFVEKVSAMSKKLDELENEPPSAMNEEVKEVVQIIRQAREIYSTSPTVKVQVK